MRKKLIALALIASVNAPSYAGFPVLDGTNLIQKITEYTLLLTEYEQILQQTGLNTNQLLTALNEYEQMLREYQVLLNQVKAFERKIDRRDYQAVASSVNRFYEQHQGKQEAQNTESVTRRYGAVTPKADLEKLADDALGYMPDDIYQSYTIASDSNIQDQQRQLYASRNAQSRKDVAHLDAERLNLGDQSELATLQMLVEQNQVLIEQIQNANEVQLAGMTYSNQLDQRAAQNEYKAKIERLKRIQWENENPIVINERPLR
ncbi:hypothetical protein [Vibrio scophthalmi]|uniref:Uncharacterized protein n=1 Tax=Vibrio scophthalmi LMG 19158 TaxID=870967 RepID=F9RNA2_9VIBR|nr:hypothetical protein [Vibrio scophthalmi]EGU37247.1 hypothetical protein VIS19158_03532 [Vibrio scophthalmi LMG 19158]